VSHSYVSSEWVDNYHELPNQSSGLTTMLTISTL